MRTYARSPNDSNPCVTRRVQTGVEVVHFNSQMAPSRVQVLFRDNQMELNTAALKPCTFEILLRSVL